MFVGNACLVGVKMLMLIPVMLMLMNVRFAAAKVEKSGLLYEYNINVAKRKRPAGKTA